MSTREHRVVTTDGTTLHAEVTGPDDAPVTLVAVHGWTQNRRTWDRVFDTLPSAARRVRYDLRGHGRSEPARPGTATIDRLADDLAEVIAELAPEGRLVLAGHSMGGMTLMALADRHPDIVTDRVNGVALVSTSCGGMHRMTLGLPGALGRGAAATERKLAAALESYRGERVPLRSAAARAGARWLVFGRGPRRSDVASVAEQVLAAHPASVGAFQTAISGHERRAALARLRAVPGVVCVGTVDRLCPPRHARVIADEWESGRLVLYPGAGHMLPQERAHDVAEHLTDLLTPALRPVPAH